MKNNFSSLSDTELVSRIGAFCSVALENPTNYGLNGAEVEALSDTNVLLDTAIDSYSEWNNGKLAASATKDARRGDVLTQMSSIIKRVYGDPTVNDSTLAKAGLAPRPSGPTFATPNTPTGFTATVVGPNDVTLRWNRAGNISATMYFIEVKRGETGAWTLLNSVTSTKFSDDTVAPGQPVSYRLYAKRGNRKSGFSSVAQIWPNDEEGQETLHLAA